MKKIYKYRFSASRYFCFFIPGKSFCMFFLSFLFKYSLQHYLTVQVRSTYTYHFIVMGVLLCKVFIFYYIKCSQNHECLELFGKYNSIWPSKNVMDKFKHLFPNNYFPRAFSIGPAVELRSTRKYLSPET